MRTFFPFGKQNADRWLAEKKCVKEGNPLWHSWPFVPFEKIDGPGKWNKPHLYYFGVDPCLVGPACPLS